MEFVNNVSKHYNIPIVWVEAKVNPEKGKGTTYKIVDFETASRNGEPFKEVIKKYGLPSKMWRHCTRELKDKPIHSLAKEYFGSEPYFTTLGIRADEPKRLTPRKGILYPLADIGIDEKFVREWWKKQPFDLELKDYQGNCDLCFLKSKRKRLTILSESPNIATWWKEMEDTYADEKRPMFDVRGRVTIDDLVKMAQQPFEKAVDKQDARDMQPSFDLDLDTGFSCFCENV